MFNIHPNGTITPADENALRLLMEHAGTWKSTAVGPDLLILRRQAEGRMPDASVAMCGEMRKGGWLIELFSFVGNARLSGTLVTNGIDTIRRDFFFDVGMLKMASSTAMSDLFGEFAVEQGAITREQLAAALAAQTPGTKLGQILLEQGLLTGQRIHQLLCKKIEKIFFDALLIEQGVYYFLTGTDLPRLPASIRIDTQGLLLEAARRIDEKRFQKEQGKKT